jgi:hypothetical protein
MSAKEVYRMGSPRGRVKFIRAKHRPTTGALPLPRVQVLRFPKSSVLLIEVR